MQKLNTEVVNEAWGKVQHQKSITLTKLHWLETQTQAESGLTQDARTQILDSKIQIATHVAKQ